MNTITKQGIQENKVILVIGIPCSGKSISTYNTFVKNSKLFESKYDLMRYTECDDYYLIGWYHLQGNRKGSDTIERKQVGLLFDQIIKLINRKNVIVEGNRAISRPMFYKLIENNIKVEILWFKCNLDVAMQRASKDREIKGNDQINIMNKVNKSCQNFYKDTNLWSKWKIIDTTNINDFSDFKLEE